jgi:hypothetical protein
MHQQHMSGSASTERLAVQQPLAPPTATAHTTGHAMFPGLVWLLHSCKQQRALSPLRPKSIRVPTWQCRSLARMAVCTSKPACRWSCCSQQAFCIIMCRPAAACCPELCSLCLLILHRACAGGSGAQQIQAALGNTCTQHSKGAAQHAAHAGLRATRTCPKGITCENQA